MMVMVSIAPSVDSCCRLFLWRGYVCEALWTARYEVGSCSCHRPLGKDYLNIDQLLEIFPHGIHIPSSRQISTVHRHRHTSHEACIIRSQEYSCFGNLVWLTKSSPRMLRDNGLVIIISRPDCLSHRCLDIPRTDGVDVNVVGSIFKGCHPRDPNAGVLASDVARSSGYADPASYAGHVDDPATITVFRDDVLLEHLCDGVFAAQEDSFGVDLDGPIEGFLFYFMHALPPAGLVLLQRDTGVVDHAVSFVRPMLDGAREVAEDTCLPSNEALTCPDAHTSRQLLLSGPSFQKIPQRQS